MKKKLLTAVLSLAILAGGTLAVTNNLRPGQSPVPPVQNSTNKTSTAWTSTGTQYDSGAEDRLKVHFVDVGQADCILIQTPDGKNILIDAGNNEDGTKVLSYLRSNNVQKVDVLVGTHPHEDHIGSMDLVIKNFDIGKIYMPRVSSNTKTFRDVLSAIKEKGLKVSAASGGVPLDAGSRVKAEMLAPNSSTYEDINNYSAVIKLSYGDTAFLFAGDAEKVSEQEMLSAKYNLKADVLKVGHHGSSSSTSSAFLKAVSPKYAVISVGKDNDYGHPSQHTLDKLADAGIQVLRTDQSGTIIMISDGKTITVERQ